MPLSGLAEFRRFSRNRLSGKQFFNFPGNLAKRLKRWQYKFALEMNKTAATKACNPYLMVASNCYKLSQRRVEKVL
jgi:hypothetical protein